MISTGADIKTEDKPFDQRNLAIILLLGLLHGIIYVFLIPAWQHYDEPNHFEYAWLIANRGSLPSPKDSDPAMRRAVARSMIRNDFYRDMDNIPDVSTNAQTIWIGPISQLTNPPLYYAAASLAIRPLLDQKLELQLTSARFVSLAFYLITLWAAWGVMVQIAPLGHPLKLLVPLSIAMLPGFTDGMTAVNNDSAAVAMTSVCLWSCVRVAKGNKPAVPILIGAVTSVLSLASKETAFASIPIFVLALALGIFRGKYRKLVWGGILAGILGLFISAVSWEDAALWYRSSSQESASQIPNTRTALGEYAFVVDPEAEVTPTWLVPFFQPVLAVAPREAPVQSYTLGAWMWADKPVEARSPLFGDGFRVHSVKVSLGTEPSFHAFTIQVDPHAGVRSWVSLDPDPSDVGAKIYYDGLVLVDQAFSEGESPIFDRADAESGEWGGVRFTNLIRNGSAENPGSRIAPWLDNLGARFFPDHIRPSLLVTYALDWQGAGWNYRLSAERLLRTFWGQFGWGHVSLLGKYPYRWLALFTLVGAAGAGIWFIRGLVEKKGRLRWEHLALLGALFVLTWAATISRGAIYLGITRLYLPVARYAFPAIIPTAGILCLGWYEVYRTLVGRLRLKGAAPVAAMGAWLIYWIGLDIYSIGSILAYYRN